MTTQPTSPHWGIICLVEHKRDVIVYPNDRLRSPDINMTLHKLCFVCVLSHELNFWRKTKLTVFF